MAASLRIGILYPLSAAEDDYPRMAAALVPPVEVRIVHTDAVDLHDVDVLRETGDREHILPGAAELRAVGVDVCMWACTSGSFVFGVQGARRQAQEVAEVVGAPASSTSLAFLQALHALNLTRVAIAASYPEKVAQAFVSFLAEEGVAALHLGTLGLLTGVEVGNLGREAILRFARENDHRDAQAILIPDTALHSVDYLEDLEQHTGKIVLTANQVTMWEALRLAGRLAPQSGFGRLMKGESYG
ncbi:MAG: decarboxylase [Chloroflexi bacterium]|nr:decarboxylase [Chloroflexota bacterium]